MPAESAPISYLQSTVPQAAPRIANPGIVIGLVNIMPATAVKSTEALFRKVLQAASGTQDVRLRCFVADAAADTLNGAPGTGPRYETLESLWRDAQAVRLDGLIVTGTEPQAALMEHEPCWPALRKLCNWAAEHTISTLWSCFSAHAAVLHLDGIARQGRAQKLSGIYPARKAAEHFVVKDLPEQWLVPHSRYNGLDEAALRDRGYQILSHAPRIGVDSFAKQHGKSAFVFFQGHLEYGPPVLLGEYLRDVRRFVAGERAQCPKLPENYFDAETEQLLAEWREAGELTDRVLRPEFATAMMRKLGHAWREPAQRVYAAWLDYIGGQKNQANPARLAYGG